jgi:thioesterase domain-containing protein
VSVAELLSELSRRDIEVRLDGEQLRLNAPAGALTAALRDTLRERKSEILHFLRSAQALANQPRAIVPLQSKGTRVPMFGVPGHNGDVFCYRELAQTLGDEQPFYGLQPPGLDGNAEPLSSVEELARYFAHQIRSFHQGPCILTGFCGGGTIAFELAQQLQRSGADVRFIALIGAPHPSFFRAPGIDRRILHRVERIKWHVGELASRSWKERARYLGRVLSRTENEGPGDLDPVIRLRTKVEEVTLHAVRQYVPRHFAGRVCFVLPSRYWARAGFGALDWRSIAQESEEYYGPIGSNADNMLREPRVRVFADILRRCCSDTACEPARSDRAMMPERAVA